MKVKQIHKRRLAKALKNLSSKPLPKIKAFKLGDDYFDEVIRHRHCLEDEFREIEEWGRVLSTKGTDACVFSADETDEADYVF